MQKLDTRQLIDRPIEPIGVWLIQRDGRVVFISRAMWEWMNVRTVHLTRLRRSR